MNYVLLGTAVQHCQGLMKSSSVGFFPTWKVLWCIYAGHGTYVCITGCNELLGTNYSMCKWKFDCLFFIDLVYLKSVYMSSSRKRYCMCSLIAQPSRAGQLGLRLQKKGGPGALPWKIFCKIEAKFCTLGTFGIVSHKIMHLLFVHGGGETHNYSRSTWYAMAQVSDSYGHSTHFGLYTDQYLKSLVKDL